MEWERKEQENAAKGAVLEHAVAHVTVVCMPVLWVMDLQIAVTLCIVYISQVQEVLSIFILDLTIKNDFWDIQKAYECMWISKGGVTLTGT